MNVSLYQAAAALNANARWQELITENLAASSTPGFKRQDMSFSAVQAGLALKEPSAVPYALPTAEPAVNFSPGELRNTGVPTDIAIEGKGFFEVQLPDGTTAYTRDGEFHIGTNGQLTTKQGHSIMGANGPIVVDQNSKDALAVSANGTVSQGANILGQLRVVEFSNNRLLTQAGGGYFLARDPNIVPTDVAEPSVRQGFLEGANTSPMVEMASLITAMRAFEANQRVIQLNDERMSKAISELGAPI